jgi:hypothetical protein
MEKYILLIIATILFSHTKAQEIINVCGNDTIVLEVENYENGLIEWEESTDNTNWITIPEQHGEKYKFWPTETKYYRASVKTSTCEPLISAVTLVQIPPTANAGTDRYIGGNSTTLLANTDEGIDGNWSFLQGSGGQLLAPSEPYCGITGEYGQKYSIIWTLSNVCGQDKDTVNITFEEIVSKNNFIVVDNTDDLVEITEGKIKIKFSDPTILPFDSVILIGMREDTSFFLRTKSFSLKDGIYDFVTENARLEDVFESGTINIGDAVNQSMNDTKKYGAFPTRETLKLKSKNKGLTVLYASGFYDESGNSYQRKKSFSLKDGLYLGVSNKTLFSSADNSTKLYTNETFISIKPNFVADISFEITRPFVRNIKIGIDNAGLEFGYDLVFTAEKDKDTLLYAEKNFVDISKRITVMIGPVPVVIIPGFRLRASAYMNASAKLTIEKSYNNKKTYTALIAGSDIKSLKLIKHLTNRSTNSSSFDLDGKFHAEFMMGPEVSVSLYGKRSFDTYLYLPAKLDLDVCSNNLNWQANIALSYEGRLGVRAELFSRKLFNIFFKWGKPLISPIVIPYMLEIKSGNNQMGFANKELDEPISLKVISNYGFGVPFVPVIFETKTGNGNVANNILYSNMHGMVNTNWTLGSNDENILKATILGCDGNDLSNTPVYLSATTLTENYNCADGNLSISLKTEQDNTIPVATGGIAPYSYSTDGYNFSSNVPEFPNNINDNYTVYVKDNNQCKAVRSFAIDANDICKNSNLQLEISSTGSIIQLSANYGAAPYQYSIDNPSSFTSETVYNELSSGEHTVYVKDENDCIASESLTIMEDQFPSIIAISPEANSESVAVNNFTFEWIAGEYTDPQQYDLYLKKQSGSYTLIAENLTDDQYAYNASALDYASNYVWKVVVKNSSNTEESNREFSFSTISDPYIPQTPILINPNNGQAQYGGEASLSWGSQTGNFTYDVYLDSIDGSTMIANNLSSTSYTVNNLIIDKTYYWKVKRKKPGTDLSQTSSVYSFPAKAFSTPIITNFSVANLLNTATLSANINTNGLQTTVSFEYGKTTAYGTSVFANQSPMAAYSQADVSRIISDLDPKYEYHFRVVATNSLGTTYSEDKVVSAMPPNYVYGGGIVVYVFKEGDPGYVENEAHGFAMKDLGSSVWSNFNTHVITSSEFGTGASNTTAIIDQGGDAASACGNLTSGGYSDWFLPSSDELDRIALSIVEVGSAWSSTESPPSIIITPTGDVSLYDKAFTGIGMTETAVKTSVHKVYAIRQF